MFVYRANVTLRVKTQFPDLESRQGPRIYGAEKFLLVSLTIFYEPDRITLRLLQKTKENLLKKNGAMAWKLKGSLASRPMAFCWGKRVKERFLKAHTGVKGSAASLKQPQGRMPC